MTMSREDQERIEAKEESIRVGQFNRSFTDMMHYGKYNWTDIKFAYVEYKGKTLVINPASIEEGLDKEEEIIKDAMEFAYACADINVYDQYAQLKGSIRFNNGVVGSTHPNDDYDKYYWHFTDIPETDEAFRYWLDQKIDRKNGEDIYGIDWKLKYPVGSYRFFKMMGFDHERAERAALNPNRQFDVDPKIAQDAYNYGHIHREDPNIEGPRAWVTRDYHTLFVKDVFILSA